MAQFFEGDKRQLTPPKRPDVMAPTLDKVIAAKINKPLDFADEDGGSGESLDLGPTLSLVRHTPSVRAVGARRRVHTARTIVFFFPGQPNSTSGRCSKTACRL